MSSNIFKIGMGVIIMLLGLSFQVKGSDSTIYLGDGHYKAILSTQPLDSTKANWRGSVEYYYATWDSTYKYDSDTRVLCGRNDSEYPGKLEEKFRGFLEYNISSIRNDATIDSVFLWFSGVMVGDFIIYDITSMSIRPFGAWNYEIWDEIGSAYAYIYGDSLDYSDLPRTLKLEDAECDLETHLPDTLNWFALGLMSCMEEEDGHLLHAISDTLMVYYTIPQIPPAITLNWPNESGLVLDVGQEYQVKWSAEDDNYVKYVDGWLSLDWGNTFPIYLGTQKNEYYTNPWDSSLVWIPSADQMTEQGRVMVIAYDVQDLADTAISYYDIKVTDISPPWDSVISPDGGEDLACESWQEIEWVATDNVWVDSVNIYLSLDGGITYPDTIAHSEPNDSSYSWKVPNTPSTSCRIKIIAFDPGSNSAVDISNADFTISDKTPPQVMGVWIEDEGAEVNRIEVDEDCKIKIDASDNVLVDKIDVYIDGVYFTTIDVQAESGIFSCDWVSPSSPTTVSIRAVAYDKADNSDEGITSISICWLTSDLAGATFPNSQKKLAIDETSNIHFLFSDANDNNIVRYAKSIDNGTTWPTQYKQIIGQGNFPVIALDDLDGVDKVNVCWLKGGGFYYTLWYSRDFGIPEQVPSPISGDAEFFPPVIVVDGNSLVHLALETWGYDDTKKAYIWALRYGTFPVGNPADISWEPPLDSYEVSGPPPPSPSIDVGQDNKPSIVYTKNDSVYYITKNGTSWNKIQVSDGKNPFLDVHNGVPYVTWERGNDIWHWTPGGEPENVTNVSWKPSISPQMINGNIIVWSESSEQNGGYPWYEVWYKTWDGTQWSDAHPLSSIWHHEDSKYPQIAVKIEGPDSILYCTWTEGNKSPYEIKFKCKNIIFPAVPTGLSIDYFMQDQPIVKLVWNKNMESDLAGYNLYRKDPGSTEFIKRNIDLITTNFCEDEGVWDKTFLYYVTAIDLGENESGPSDILPITFIRFQYQPCPFLYTWDGSEFVEDNNILAGSGQGDTVIDWYKLTQVPVKKNNRYVMEIREENSEHSWFDKIELLAVDHPDSVMIFVQRDGTILPLVDLLSPTLCADENGEDYTDMVEAADEVYYQGYEEKSLVSEFERESTVEEYAMVLRPSEKYPPHLDIATYEDGEYEYIGSVVPREHWSTEAIALALSGEDTTTKVKITWHAPHKLDYIGLGRISAAEYFVKPCPLTAAVHSRDGSVKQKLLNEDEKYAELIPGDTIKIEFAITGTKPGWVRDFIFVSNGYYTTEENIAMGGAQSAGAYSSPQIFSISQNYPNPFCGKTVIRYSLPENRKVSLKIYDVTGRLVKTLIDGDREPGIYTAKWDAKNMPSGIYFARFIAGDYINTKKLILVK